ncbi:MAG TPA: hypothetical protein VGJ90_05955 [Methylophilaceae bacterium]
MSVFSLSVIAAPAAWYKWRSKEDGTIICSQVPLGEGWEVVDGPYKDLQCRVAGKPG